MIAKLGPENPLSSTETEFPPQIFSVGITCQVNGAGSTTTAKMLAEILGFGYEYAGDIRRRLAVRTGYAEHFEDDEGIARFESEVSPEYPQTDTRLDYRVISKARNGNFVIEGKAAVALAKANLSPVKDSTSKKWSLSLIEPSVPIFTVLLTCNEETAARRVLLRKRLDQLKKQGVDPSTISKEERQRIMDEPGQEEVNKQIKISRKRTEATRRNWNHLYKFSGENFSKIEQGLGAYDLKELDTAHLTPEQVIAEIIAGLKEKKLISPEQEKEALIELLLRTENPSEVAIFFNELTRKEGYKWSAIFLDKLFQQPELFKGSKWFIQTLHCLTGPLPDLPQGVDQKDSQGTFRSGDTVYIVKTKAGIEILPHSQDIELIMNSFCQKLDSTLEQLNQLEQKEINTQPVRFDLASWTYILMALIHPFWDGNGRVTRNLFQYILGPKKEIIFPLNPDLTSPSDSLIDQRLTHIIGYFLINNWLVPSEGEVYFEQFKQVLLRHIKGVSLETPPLKRPFFHMNLNLDLVFPLQNELKKCLAF